MNFADMLPYVLPSVAGCPDSVATEQLCMAARVFCARTNIWNYSSNTILSVSNEANYTLQLDPGRELCRVLGVEVGCREYYVPNAVRGRRAARHCWHGRQAVFQGPQDFTLTPVPLINGEPIIVDISVKPAMGTTYWPDDFTEFAPDLANAAIANLCLLPRQEWSNDRLAKERGAAFLERCGVIALKVSRGFGNSYQHAKVTWF